MGVSSVLGKSKRILKITFILALLALGVTIQSINLGMANPYIKVGGKNVPPDVNTKPPSILILSPENNTLHSQVNLSLTLNVSVGESTTASQPIIFSVYYKADWQPNITSVYGYIPDASVYPSPTIATFNATVELTGIPEGNRNVTVYAQEVGSYIRLESQFMFLDDFGINNTAAVFFAIDTTPPNISVFTIENATYATSDVPLGFVTNEAVSQISYILDGQGNVTISGNTTLTGLSDGTHNVTVYATDIAGNVGSSETVVFSVTRPEQFPTAPVAAASLATVAVVGVGLLVYLRKRAHREAVIIHG